MADIGIVPSVYDHCPYTVLEMMANNIPLIVSRINGLDELLDDTLCIFINAVLSIEGDISFDIKDLSNTILMFSQNKSLRSELTARSFEVLTERFASSCMAEDMSSLFISLAEYKNTITKHEKIKRR